MAEPFDVVRAAHAVLERVDHKTAPRIVACIAALRDARAAAFEEAAEQAMRDAAISARGGQIMAAAVLGHLHRFLLKCAEIERGQTG